VPSTRVELRRDLGVADLTLTQVLFIVGLPWVGVAAKQGPAHVVLWLAAIVLFYLPSAAVVIYLNRAMPLEGGLYQWAKLGFNDLVGFLVAWNLWLFAILNTSEIGLQITQYFHYLMSPERAALMANSGVVALVNLVILGALVLVTIRGLGLGKWVHKLGGVLMLTTFALLMIVPWLNLANGTLAEFHPLATAMPVATIFSFNIAA
jgi:amino acid transporter